MKVCNKTHGICKHNHRLTSLIVCLLKLSMLPSLSDRKEIWEATSQFVNVWICRFVTACHQDIDFCFGLESGYLFPPLWERYDISFCYHDLDSEYLHCCKNIGYNISPYRFDCVEARFLASLRSRLSLESVENVVLIFRLSVGREAQRTLYLTQVTISKWGYKKRAFTHIYFRRFG